VIAIGDRPGNNRIDGMKNIIDNPSVVIIFMVPGSNTTYRVNGVAEISIKPNLLDRFEVRGKLPRAVIAVSLDEALPQGLRPREALKSQHGKPARCCSHPR